MLLAWLRALSLYELMALLLLANATMYLGSLGLVAALQRALPERLLNRAPVPISRADVVLSLVIAAINTLGNFGFFTPFWDRLLGTQLAPD